MRLACRFSVLVMGLGYACATTSLRSDLPWQQTLVTEVGHQTFQPVTQRVTRYFDSYSSKRFRQIFEGLIQPFPSGAHIRSLRWRVVQSLDAPWGFFDTKERCWYAPLGLFQAFFYEHEWLLFLEIFGRLTHILEENTPKGSESALDIWQLASQLQAQGVFEAWFKEIVQESILNLHQAGREVRGIAVILKVLDQVQPRPQRIPQSVFGSLSQQMGRYIAENIAVRQAKISIDSEFFEIQGILKAWDLQYELN